MAGNLFHVGRSAPEGSTSAHGDGYPIETDGLEKRMTDGQQAHLFASLVAFHELVRQMERVGRQGKSPVAGQELTPLQTDTWKGIEELLDAARDRLEDAVRRMAPGRLESRDAQEGLGATLFWLAILLRQLNEEVIDDLDPARVERKFGAMTEDERVELAELVRELRRCTHQVQQLLEAARRA